MFQKLKNLEKIAILTLDKTYIISYNIGVVTYRDIHTTEMPMLSMCQGLIL